MAGELGPSGRVIWDAYQGDKLPAGHAALVREYARVADTLDRLDDLAVGRRDGWATLVFDDMGEIHLNIDKVLDTQMKAQAILKQIHGELRQAGITAAAGGGSEQEIDEPEDMLAKLRREKERRERQSG